MYIPAHGVQLSPLLAVHSPSQAALELPFTPLFPDIFAETTGSALQIALCKQELPPLQSLSPAELRMRCDTKLLLPRHKRPVLALQIIFSQDVPV